MSCCNCITQSGFYCCLNVFVLAEVLKVTNAVILACKTPAAAIQAPGLCSLSPLGLVPLLAAAIMLPNLPMSVVMHRFLSSAPCLQGCGGFVDLLEPEACGLGGWGKAERTELQLCKNSRLTRE